MEDLAQLLSVLHSNHPEVDVFAHWSTGDSLTIFKKNTCSVIRMVERLIYRSGTVNPNTVNSKFHLIRSFFEIFARFLSFHV